MVSRRDLHSFRSLRDRRRRLGQKSLVQRSVLGDLHVRRRTTWGMSVEWIDPTGDMDIERLMQQAGMVVEGLPVLRG